MDSREDLSPEHRVSDGRCSTTERVENLHLEQSILHGRCLFFAEGDHWTKNAIGRRTLDSLIAMTLAMIPDEEETSLKRH